MIRLALLWAVMLLVSGCAGDQEMQDPVGGDDSAPAIPDSPGSGETAAKPAGDGFESGGSEDQEPAKKDEPKKMEQAESDPSGRQFVQSDGLNVRSGAGMKFDVVRILPWATEVTVQGECDSVWCQIGENEYVSKRFLGPEKPQSK